MAGAAIVGGATLTSSASAHEEENGNGRSGAYGNGNGVGAFLNEEAEFKNQPVWDSGVADMTGNSEVEVVVGALSSVDIPEELVPPGEEAPDVLPIAFAPVAVKVSPGTDVTWTWAPGIHHSVTSLDGTGEEFDAHGDPGDQFTYTFENVGNYLYYCHPHGTPYPLPFPEPVGEVENLFGMRGAVLVTDD